MLFRALENPAAMYTRAKARGDHEEMTLENREKSKPPLVPSVCGVRRRRHAVRTTVEIVPDAVLDRSDDLLTHRPLVRVLRQAQLKYASLRLWAACIWGYATRWQAPLHGH